MPISHPNFGHIAKMIAAQLGVSAQVVDRGSKGHMVEEFMGAEKDGVEPRMALLFYLQPDGSVVMPTGTDVPLTGKCAYCIRLTEPSKEVPGGNALDDSVNFGTLSGTGSPMQTLMMMVSQLYQPLVAKKAFGFSKKMTAENLTQLSAQTDAFTMTLEKSIESLDMAMLAAAAREDGRVEPVEDRQRLPPTLRSLPSTRRDTAPSLSRTHTPPSRCPSPPELLATDTPFLSRHTQVRGRGHRMGRRDLQAPRREGGRRRRRRHRPAHRAAFWRKRATKLNSICDDLRSTECQVVVMVLTACKSRKLKTWKANNNLITDALNEAKDNVKYLSTLDKYIAPLYDGRAAGRDRLALGAAQQPAHDARDRELLRDARADDDALREDHRADDRQLPPLGHLLRVAVGAADDRAPPRLQVCYDLFSHYRGAYEATRDKLRETPQAKQFEFGENVIFSKSNLFQRRVEKLIDLFTTVDQFTNLAKHDLEGMEALMANFFNMVADFKRKPYDLFDFQVNQFDRDYLEFLANIHELESSLQGFINSSFEHITSTEAAMTLLDQLRHMLQRDSLKDDLESKRLTIFQHFLGDLEVVSRTYEKLKNNPPLVRNVPPVTGNVLVGAPAHAAHRGADAAVPQPPGADGAQGLEEGGQGVQQDRAHGRRVRGALGARVGARHRGGQVGPAVDAHRAPPADREALRQLRPPDPRADEGGQVPAPPGPRDPRVGQDGAHDGGQVQAPLQPALVRLGEYERVMAGVPRSWRRSSSRTSPSSSASSTPASSRSRGRR